MLKTIDMNKIHTKLKNYHFLLSLKANMIHLLIFSLMLRHEDDF